MADIWHYPRQEMAQTILSTFESNMSSSLTIFAPRRMGKTELLRKDVAPLAEDHGWRVFYFSFYEIQQDPMIEFERALLFFSHGDGMLGTVKRKLASLGSVSAAVDGVGEAGVQIGASDESLTQLFARIAKFGKVLLLLDEVQLLSTKADQGFVGALRTALDMHNDQIKTIFTGSSREGLVRMFSRATAPFFHFSTNVDLPYFDERFTKHLALCFRAATTRSIDEERLWKIFNEMGRVPKLVRGLVERMTLNPSEDMETAAATVIAELNESAEYAQNWASCTPLEKVVLIHIARRGKEIYSETGKKILAGMLGLESIGTASVQSCLRGLQGRNLLFKPPAHGAPFEIEDSMFRQWILAEIGEPIG